MLKLILIATVILASLAAIGVWKPEWLRRAVEALIAAGAAVTAWEWERVTSAISGLF